MKRTIIIILIFFLTIIWINYEPKNGSIIIVKKALIFPYKTIVINKNSINHNLILEESLKIMQNSYMGKKNFSTHIFNDYVYIKIPDTKKVFIMNDYQVRELKIPLNKKIKFININSKYEFYTKYIDYKEFNILLKSAEKGEN